MIEVFVVGALHLDVVVTAERLPQLDETLMGNEVAYRFGGKGGNQALAAARMGAATAMAGRVGDDGFAETILHTLHAAAVDHGQVRQVPGASGMSVAIVEGGGEYGAVVVSGVNQTIDPAEVDVAGARVLLLQNEIPESVNLALARSSAPRSLVVLNAAPARLVSKELLDHVGLLVVNRLEACQMAGFTTESAEVEPMARALSALANTAVIVTLGKEGAALFDGERYETIPPPARSTGSAHGAGDAFVGALAAEIAGGADLKAATEFAALAAAHFVQVAPEDRVRITRRAVLDWGTTL